MALDYPSYILALAMGAGKTALIGAIIATEFAMALEYPDGPFVQRSILERLQQQAGLLQPKIDDWRAMVDRVTIDPAYDGKVFNIALADVPERKTDYVQGCYELPAPKGKTTVAVKVTDMLGEEVVVTKML